MVLGTYVTLDQTTLYNGNYSDVAGLKVTGTVYSDVNKTTAFNLTGYTITLRMYKENGFSDQFNQTATITTAASGTFYISIASGTLPYAGLYLLDVALSKSGTLVSNLNRIEILIIRGPTN